MVKEKQRSTSIVTGGSRGFGQALAGELADAGWLVVVDARDGAALEEATAGQPDIIPIAGSVIANDHLDALVTTAAQQGDLQLIINNASILGPSPQPDIATYPIDVLRNVFEVNVLGPVQLIQKALPYLRANGGTIVNITSDAGVEQYEGWGGYGASKAALEQISNVLAAEEPDICVYWVDPGDMRTRMHQEAFPGEDISDRPLPETRTPGLMRLLEDRPPSGRYTLAALLEQQPA